MISDLNRTGLEKLCKEFSTAFNGVISWQWDDYFGTVMAQFDTVDREKVRAILDQYLNFTWDISNIGKAPDTVQAVNSGLGNLREGQMLMSSDTQQDACILCAWWPWGNGEKISIRIIPTCKKLTDSERGEVKEVFKSWFGI